MQFGRKSYTWFQSWTSAQREFDLMFYVWFQTKIGRHEAQLPINYIHFWNHFLWAKHNSLFVFFVFFWIYSIAKNVCGKWHCTLLFSWILIGYCSLCCTVIGRSKESEYGLKRVRLMPKSCCWEPIKLHESTAISK